KIGAILSLRGEPIHIVGRASDRVPFGTGRALREICASRSLGQPFRVYDPRVFSYLRIWLEVLSSLTEKSSVEEVEKRILAAAACKPGIDGDLLNGLLKGLGAPKALSQARLRSSRPETLRRHLHIWFDAFRTLKLIHSLTRRALPRIEL